MGKRCSALLLCAALLCASVSPALAGETPSGGARLPAEEAGAYDQVPLAPRYALDLAAGALSAAEA